MPDRPGFVSNLFGAWRAPRASMQKMLASGAGEERAVALAAFSAVILFLGSLPDTIQSAQQQGQEVSSVVGLRLGIALFFMPLVLYALAALGHLVFRALGNTGSFLIGRLSCFWALVVSGPAILLGALGEVFLPQSVNLVFDIAIVLIWLNFWRLFESASATFAQINFIDLRE